MKSFFLINLLIFFCLLSGCFKEDEQVTPYIGVRTIIKDSVQLYQSYYDLETDSVIRTHPLSEWQLGFESSESGWRIITNSGAGWFIYNTGLVQSSEPITMPVTFENLYDIQSMWPDSTAIGNWISVSDSVYSNRIYLLGQFSGNRYVKIYQVKFLHVNSSHYRFSFRDQTTETTDTAVVHKEESVNFVYYDLTIKRTKNLEPEKNRYDLVFGSYYDIATLFNQTMPYKVGGVLLNPDNTYVTIDSVTGYAAIDYEMALNFEFSQQRDIPGYRWKTPTVDITGGGGATYDVKSNITYIFKTMEGNYFKLRFLSYTLNGMSGYPQFEFARLEPGGE